MASKLTQLEVQKRFHEILGDNVTVVSKFKSTRQHVIVETPNGRFRLLPKDVFSGKAKPCLRNAYPKKIYIKKQLRNQFGTKVKVLSNHFDVRWRVRVDTPFGVCLMKLGTLMKGNFPSIKYAIDKQDFFRNMIAIFYQNKIFVIDDYIDDYTPITFFDGIGEFKLKPNQLIKIKKLDTYYKIPTKSINKNYNLNNIKLKHYLDVKSAFVNLSRKQFGFHYDYSRVSLGSHKINNNTMVVVGCPIHGWFAINPKKHINGVGCPFCNNLPINHLTRKLQAESLKCNDDNLKDFCDFV